MLIRCAKRLGRYGNKQIVGQFGPATTLEQFWAHWSYARQDYQWQALSASTAYYGIWDDHEVVNDFGPQTDSRALPPYIEHQALMPNGLKAFVDYTPMHDSAGVVNLYRSVQLGKHAELFFLDTRQFRDNNLQVDDAEQHKSMLGQRQLSWLMQALKESTALWKIIVSSVPIAIPTGFPSENGRDGWANLDGDSALTRDGVAVAQTGFEREIKQILKTLQTLNSNAVFITTDVHFAEGFVYTPFAEAPDFHVYEMVVGPGNAGIFPNQAFDKTFSPERLFFYGPESAEAVRSWEVAKQWFNYGVIEIDLSGQLMTKIKNTSGTTVFQKVLQPN